MTETTGGFAGDPAAALNAGGTGGCCGNAPAATLDLPEPSTRGACCETAASGPCCDDLPKAAKVGCCA